MLTNSQLIHHNQAIIPHLVIEALKLRDGDAIVFEIDQAGVHLHKAPAIDQVFTEALLGTLGEWESAADNEAYANL